MFENQTGPARTGTSLVLVCCQRKRSITTILSGELVSSRFQRQTSRTWQACDASSVADACCCFLQLRYPYASLGEPLGSHSRDLPTSIVNTFVWRLHHPPREDAATCCNLDACNRTVHFQCGPKSFIYLHILPHTSKY